MLVTDRTTGQPLAATQVKLFMHNGSGYWVVQGELMTKVPASDPYYKPGLWAWPLGVQDVTIPVAVPAETRQVHYLAYVEITVAGKVTYKRATTLTINRRVQP